MLLTTLIQWGSYALGVGGAIGCAMPTRRARFIGFIISTGGDLGWAIFGYTICSPAMIAMQATYGIVCVVGLWNNRPVKQKHS